jgi:hypothetical protein
MRVDQRNIAYFGQYVWQSLHQRQEPHPHSFDTEKVLSPGVRDDFGSFNSIGRKRFLAKHRFAGIQCRDRIDFVALIGRSHIDDIYVGLREKFRVIGVAAIRSEGIGEGAGTVLAARSYCHDSCVL